MAEIAVKAVLTVADKQRKDVDLELIKIVQKIGGSIENTEFIEGMVIDKGFSHPQMGTKLTNAKVCILTCPFEPPKPKSKYQVDISSSEQYKQLHQIERAYFTDMVKRCKDSGADIIFCQWGFDDEANHLLLENGLTAVRWVSGTDIELLAMATGSRIIPRFEDITPEKLGFAKTIEETTQGTTTEKMIIVRESDHPKSVTILIKGGSKTICDETHRCIHDAICVVRNLLKDQNVVVGGGACELNSAIKIRKQAEDIATIDQFMVKAFADALEQIPMILAENSGMNPI